MSGYADMVPSAERLMNSLRDIGYDLGSAVADVVDNSVDAGAERVAIDLRHDGYDSWIRISDDGVGMTERRLDEAMRYGSRRAYGGDDLGRFGLGLKTASLSQCRSLTVASRSTPRARLAVRRWDLDRIAETDTWALERMTSRTADSVLVEPLRDSGGTVVLWRKLDRVEAYAVPEGARAAAALEKDAAALREHLGVVFHRFLDGSAAGPSLRIDVNGEHVEAWDPFSRGEQGTQELRVQQLAYEGSGGVERRVTVAPYILPSRPEYASQAAHDRAGGPKRWNRQQGLYIYRNDRLVQAGGWNRMRTMDEHSKLARIALDMPALTEAEWRLNVSKMSVSVPPGLRAELRALVGSVVGIAQERYRNAGLPGSAEDEEPRLTAIAAADSFQLADHWAAISRVLERELAGSPDTLDRVLEQLINSEEVRSGADSADAA